MYHQENESCFHQHISIGKSKKDLTPLLMHWSYVFFLYKPINIRQQWFNASLKCSFFDMVPSVLIKIAEPSVAPFTNMV